MLFMISVLIGINTIYNANAVPEDETTEASTKNTEESDIQMGTAYIKSLYSSDIEISENDIFVITYTIRGYNENATITVDASTITDTPIEMDMPVADYLVTDIEYQGSNENIKKQGFGATLNFKSAPKGGTVLYLSIGKEQNEYIGTQYAETFIMDNEHIYGPTNDPALGGRFNSATDASEVTTEYEYTTEDIDFDIEYDDNYGVEEQIQDGTQKPEIEHYNDVDEEDDEEEKPKNNSSRTIIFALLLMLGGIGMFVYIRKKS